MKKQEHLPIGDKILYVLIGGAVAIIVIELCLRYF
jgi:hypothetical protein